MTSILAIDLGTSSVRAVLFSKAGTVLAIEQQEYPCIYPQEGYVEQDPVAIWTSTVAVLTKLLSLEGCGKDTIAAVGITNQRETTVIWDRETGAPFFPAIVWSDTRTDHLCATMAKDGGKNRFRSKTGLPLRSYFSAPKIKWILDNVAGVREAAESGRALFGTMDTWLVWQLTNRKLFITDVSNASRTLLMNIHSLEWDEELLSAFGVPRSMLPAIKSSSDVYGACEGGVLDGIRIAGILGDQQAALFGQSCFKPGDAKNTYGTGGFMMMNTGHVIVPSNHGLLSTVGYKLGSAPVVYALEGAVAVCGSLIKWLRDSLGLIATTAETGPLASSVPSTGDVIIVPAFSGLFAPHWRPDARGIIIGITAFTNKAHIVRAALEACAYQTLELVEAMEMDIAAHFSVSSSSSPPSSSPWKLTSLRVDGGMVVNEFMTQFQADVLQREVIRPAVWETTALGAAYAAGLAVGFWSSLEELSSQWSASKIWTPSLPVAARDHLISRWKAAVPRSFEWANVTPQVDSGL